jgi:hypothetical protein
MDIINEELAKTNPTNKIVISLIQIDEEKNRNMKSRFVSNK